MEETERLEDLFEIPSLEERYKRARHDRSSSKDPGPVLLPNLKTRASSVQNDEDRWNVNLTEMRKVNRPEDIILAPLKGSKLKCLWPMRRIRCLTGLGLQTQQQLREAKIVIGGRVHSDNKLYAYINGEANGRWFIRDMRNYSKELVDFENSAAREQIRRELAREPNRERQRLKLAMELATRLFETACRRLSDLEGPSEVNSLETNPTDCWSAVEQKPRVPLDIQTQHQVVKPVSFQAGMYITILSPNFPQRRVRITKISENLRISGGFDITLEDNTVLVDDILVGAGENELMFPFGEYKRVSVFQPGCHGLDVASRVKQRLADFKTKADEFFQTYPKATNDR